AGCGDAVVPYARRAEDGRMVSRMASENTPEHDGPILTFTDSAREKLIEYLDQHNLRGQGAIRVAVQGRNAGAFDYAMAVEEQGQPEPDDTVLDAGDFKVFVDTESLPNVRGAQVDYVDELMAGGFRIHN